MKFEDLLMQPSEERSQRRRDLEEEVEQLQLELNGELQIKGVLQCALDEPGSSCPCIPRMSSLLPHKIQMLLEEIEMVEEEVINLERKVDDLKLNLYKDQQQNKEWEMSWSKDLQPQRQHKRSLVRAEHHIEAKDCEKLPISRFSDERRKLKMLKERRSSLGSSMDVQSFLPKFNESLSEGSSYARRQDGPFDIEIDFEKPNKLSEELMSCLISIFLRLNKEALKTKESAIVLKDGVSYTMNSKGFISKNSCNNSTAPTPTSSFEGKTSNSDPYGILSDTDGAIRDVGSYKNFIQITRNTLDPSWVTSFHPEMRKLRVLIHELSNVDLTYLSYKQKLAFWINIYNACIMQALLQHGLPPTKEKLLGLMKESTVNVGGLVLNALAIERFILRLPSNSKQTNNEKEIILRHTYGLGYPEPSITFALCRGTWSSPALRIYTPDQVVNDLEKAKVEYLEASVGIISKKRILLPKLMQWHMRDFADDMGSLVEWIYSQLPRNSTLKRLIMECLNGETKSPLAKAIEVQPYTFDFRYLLPL